MKLVGGLKVSIETDVVSYDLPLLLSKYSMQKANTKLDFENNTVMFGREIDLTFTTSGHYCIPMLAFCYGGGGVAGGHPQNDFCPPLKGFCPLKIFESPLNFLSAPPDF